MTAAGGRRRGVLLSLVVVLSSLCGGKSGRAAVDLAIAPTGNDNLYTTLYIYLDFYALLPREHAPEQESVCISVDPAGSMKSL